MRRSVLLLPIAALFLALSGFDCASTQMTTAKVAMQRKDYAAAAAALEKEVAARPNNGEAWLTLAEIYEIQMRPTDAVRALERARASTAPKLTPVQYEDSYVRQYALWRDTYNRALAANRNKDFVKALAILDTAQQIGPDYFENLYFRGTIYEEMGDEQNKRRTYEQYIAKIAPIVEQGSKLGLALMMTPAAVENKLGKPTRGELNDTLGGFYYYATPDIYVYFSPATKSHGPLVEGWKSYDSSVPDRVRVAPVILRADPYAILGLDARTASDYDRALGYLQTLSRLDPNREGVAATITQIYIDTKRIDEAIRSLNAEITANPSDARPYIELGNLYFGAERFADASKTFERVTTLSLPADDPNLRTALFNLGAVHKNLGARVQDSIKRVSNSKPSAAQIEVYLRPLRESAKYFERYRALNSSDFAVLAELANLYDVLGDTPKRNEAITQLEALGSANASNYEYWRALSRLYAILGDAKKAEAADKKATALRP